MKIVEKNIDELKFLEGNPRVELNERDNEFKQLVESILFFGLQLPLVINKDNVVISGNLTLKVLRYLHWKKVPCIVSNLISNRQIFLHIALNKIKGDWHILKLKNLVTQDKVSFKNLDSIGFTKPEIDALKLIDEFPRIEDKKQNELTLF